MEKHENITSLEGDDFKIPYWQAEQDDLILKVNSKYCMDDYEQEQMYFIDIMFTSYCMDKPPSKRVCL